VKTNEARVRPHKAASKPAKNPERSANDEWMRTAASLVLSIATFAAAAALLAHLVPAQLPDPAPFLPEAVKDLAPEPRERAVFLLGLLSMPTLPTLYYALLLRWRPTPISAGWRDGLLLGSVATWLFWVCSNSAIPNALSYLLAAAACAPLCVLARLPANKVLAAVAVALCVALLWLTWRTQVINENWFLLEFNMWHHVDILMGAINAAAHGRTVLVDMTSQYGMLWPQIAAVLTAPLSVASTSHFFAALVLIQFGFVYLALARKTGFGSGWLVLFFAAFIGLSHPLFAPVPFNLRGELVAVLKYAFACVPTYYQWVPLRTVWGAVFIWLVPLCSGPQRKWAVPLGYALAAIAVLWNVDQGLVVLVAWTGQNVYRELHRWRGERGAVLRHAALQVSLLLLTGACAWLGYSVFALLRAGEWPRWGELLRFQDIFYRSGFFMVPMRGVELWQAVVAVHLVTIAWCMRRVLRGEQSADATWKLYLALYGMGVFTYYQGRSLPEFLPTAFFPTVLLACVWVHDGMIALRSVPLRTQWRDPDKRGLLITTAIFSLWTCFGVLNFARGLPTALAFAFDETGPPRNAAGLDQLWATLTPELAGKRVLVLVEPSTYVQLKTQSISALPFAGTAEVILKEDVAKVQAVLDHEAPIVLLHKQAHAWWTKYLDLHAYQGTEHAGSFIVLKKP
jgi:hypothetical protein